MSLSLISSVAIIIFVSGLVIKATRSYLGQNKDHTSLDDDKAGSTNSSHQNAQASTSVPASQEKEQSTSNDGVPSESEPVTAVTAVTLTDEKSKQNEEEKVKESIVPQQPVQPQEQQEQQEPEDDKAQSTTATTTITTTTDLCSEEFMDEEIMEMQDINPDVLSQLLQWVNDVNKGDLSVESYEQLKQQLLVSSSSEAETQVTEESNDENETNVADDGSDEREEVMNIMDYDNEYLSSLTLTEDQIEQIYALKNEYVNRGVSGDKSSEVLAEYESRRNAIVENGSSSPNDTVDASVTNVQQSSHEHDDSSTEERQDEEIQALTTTDLTQTKASLKPAASVTPLPLPTDQSTDLQSLILNQKNALKKTVQKEKDPWASVF